MCQKSYSDTGAGAREELKMSVKTYTTNRQKRKREKNQTEGILRTTSNSFNDLGNLADLEKIDMLINIGLSENLKLFYLKDHFWSKRTTFNPLLI